MKNYTIHEVFTPASPARATFVERGSINTQIVNSLRTPGKQLVIFGHSGSGKTTLLENKLYQIYEKHITIRCDSTLKFENILNQAFDELDQYYTGTKKTTEEDEAFIGISSEYLLMKAEIKSKTSYEKCDTRVIPPVISVQTLAKFLGASKCCIVLEDFHKIDDIEKKKLSQSMKLFMDMSSIYPELKIICIGAVDTGRQVIQFDNELKNRVSEIKVPLMTNEEIRQIINLGCEKLKLKIPSFLIERIVNLSNGVPSICHAICLHVCYVKGIEVCGDDFIDVDLNDLNAAVENYLNESSDTILADFELALKQKKSKYRNAEIIFKALSEFDFFGAEYNELFLKIKEKEIDYPQGNLSLNLKALLSQEKGGLIIKRASKYLFKSPIYHTFASCYFLQVHKTEITTETINATLKQIGEQLDYLQQKYCK